MQVTKVRGETHLMITHLSRKNSTACLYLVIWYVVIRYFLLMTVYTYSITWIYINCGCAREEKPPCSLFLVIWAQISRKRKALYFFLLDSPWNQGKRTEVCCSKHYLFFRLACQWTCVFFLLLCLLLLLTFFDIPIVKIVHNMSLR